MVFVLFLSLFALDVFQEGYGILDTIVALLMHLIPAGIIVIILAFSWRKEWVGALLFIALSIFYPIWAWGRFPFITYLSISGPLFIIGILLALNWKYHAELHTG
jgi:hypothetical protein